MQIEIENDAIEPVRQELEALSTFASELNITHIYVPMNFALKVNELQGTDNYDSSRGHETVAITINNKDGTRIVLSQILFYLEPQTRFRIYLHEFSHVLSKDIFLLPNSNDNASRIYLNNLLVLLEEYYCERHSRDLHDRIFPEKDNSYESSECEHYKGHLEECNNLLSFLEDIQIAADNFRLDADVASFTKVAVRNFEIFTKSFVYLQAMIDHYGNERFPKLDMSAFQAVTGLQDLLQLSRKSYGDQQVDLNLHIPTIRKLMLSFGMMYEIRDNELYLQVLDVL